MTKPKKKDSTAEIDVNKDDNKSTSTEIKQDDNEYENDRNISINEVDHIINVRMKRQEETIINFIELQSRLINSRIDDVIKDVNSLKECGNFQEDIFDSKVKKLDEKIENIKIKMTELNFNTSNTSSGMDIDNNVIKEIKHKLNDLENRSRRSNLRFDGIKEEVGEEWSDCEKKLKKIIRENLQLNENIIIERAHRVGKRKEDGKCRSIVAKFLNYKDKEEIMKNGKKLKNTGIYINEDFSDETMKKRAELLPLLKQYRKEGKYAFIRVDEIVVRDWKKNS